MKRLRVILLGLIIVLFIGSINVMADSPIKIILNGKECVFPDVKPYVNEDNRTLVPIRFVASELGADVEWNQEESSVKITNDGKVILLRINDYVIKVNGDPLTLDTKPILKDGRTMVPLRFITETLEKNIEYQNGIVTITDSIVPNCKINLTKKLLVVDKNIYSITRKEKKIQPGIYTVKEIYNQVNLMTGETICHILAQDGDNQFYINPRSVPGEYIKMEDQDFTMLTKQIKIGDLLKVE